MFPLGVLAELLINGTWQDISQYLYQRDGITITGGAVNWGDTPQPAQMTFTVNNRDGRFSPLYAAGAYYPYLQRNVQIRLTVTATSASGNFYRGYRFWGEVTEWPPVSDISGNDVYVQVTAAGPLRRISAGGGQGSALTRYYQSLTGLLAPVAYWPCEEDPTNTGIIGAGVSGGTNMTVTTGTPTWKAISDFNGSAPVAVLNNSTWDGLTGSFGTSGDDVFLVPGTHTWVSGVSSVNAKVWGAGGGGENGYQGGPNAGGGGAFAQEATLAVTPGTAYTVVTGAGGAGGRLDNNGTNRDGAGGGFSSFQGDSVLVKANGGKGGTSAGPGAGGAIGSNTVKFAGGAGGSGAAIGLFPPSGGGGGGGGGSAGTAANGNAGSNTSTGTGAAGAAAVTGGGAGGHGGSVSDDAGITPGGSPGGGGGGGAFDFRTGAAHSGQAGGNGKVELIYTPSAAPPNNVIRFILFVPLHGGNNNRVLVRTLTSGTIAQLDILYQTGGKLILKGYNNSAVLLFTSSALTVGDGKTVMVSLELGVSGANVLWVLTAVAPGATSLLGIVSGTQNTASMGNVTEVLAGPNADITKTAIGHISVQYAIIPLLQVSRALHGHNTELSVDRFIRLANEQAIDNATEFAESADHWGFETAAQANTWVATNATRAQSAVTAGSSGTPWSFACNGTPLDGTYFIASNAQAALIQSGDQFNDTLNPGKVFTVLSVGGNFAGFNNVTIMPTAAVIMSSTDTVTQVQAQRLDPAFPAGWPTDGSHSLLITASGGAGEWYATSPTGTSGQPVLPGDIVSLGIHFYTPAALGAVRPGIVWYNAAGTLLSTTNGTSLATSAGQIGVMTMTATAPASTAFFAVKAGDNETKTAGTLLYTDNVRVSPQMGVQTRREYAAFLKEIRALDQGILKESRTLWGLSYRTRLAMINQSPAVTLDYSAGTISPPLAPVVDTQKVTNHIVVRRRGGSKITVTLDTGTMSTSEPPAGVGRMKTIPPAYIAAVDGQLAALAAHLLNLGTDPNERYPTITVNLARASIPGNALAPLMSAVAGVEIGDYVQLTNLPFWFPNSTAKQLVIGYTENINAREWTITWNCTPEAPWEVTATALRRW